MDVNNEILQAKNRIQKERDDLETKKRREEEKQRLMKLNGFHDYSPRVIKPSGFFQEILNELWVHIPFRFNKTMYKMPDGNTYIRETNPSQPTLTAIRSFDIVLDKSLDGKNSWVRSLWILENGMFAISQNGSNVNWDTAFGGKTKNDIRQIIIDAVAKYELENGPVMVSDKSTDQNKALMDKYKNSPVLKLKRYDVVTFDEQDKVIVLSNYTYNGRRFVYVNEVLPDESDVKNVFKVMEAHPEDDTLETVKDERLLSVVLPALERIHKKESKKANGKYLIGIIVVLVICIALYKLFT